ncbi:MAG TPA: triose-phosphate isomerase [Thermoanaerobaculia bacterium]|nr:triose-phosphate isomerase [Thermoanaerobaculia bacterium]
MRAKHRPLVAANWKMNLEKADAIEYCRTLRRLLAARSQYDLPGSDNALLGLGGLSGAGGASGYGAARTVIFPSFPLIPAVARELADSEVEVGAQDLHPDDRGAHTGDVSGSQLIDAGCTWALCGHSERRRDHGESDELVGRKVAAASRHGLMALLCVGETREERDQGKAWGVLERQLGAGLASRPHAVVVAYEPVWAIGTGLTASPDTAQEAHHFLRRALTKLLGARAEAVLVVYGGSVIPENAAGLIAEPDIDGFLVGGASLDPMKFLAIISNSG